jgi:hypothetical protein
MSTCLLALLHFLWIDERPKVEASFGDRETRGVSQYSKQLYVAEGASPFVPNADLYDNPYPDGIRKPITIARNSLGLTTQTYLPCSESRLAKLHVDT